MGFKTYKFSVVIAFHAADVDSFIITLKSLEHDILKNDGELVAIFDGGKFHRHTAQKIKKKIKSSALSERFNLICVKKIGLTKSLNVGINASRSGIIFRIHSGDLWVLGRAKKQLYYIKNGFDCVGNRSDGKRQIITKLEQLKKNVLIHSSVAFKKAYYCDYFEFAQDYELWLRMLSQKKTIFCSSDMFCIRYSDITSISYQKGINQLFFAFKARHQYLISLRSNIYQSLLIFLIILINFARRTITKY